jgi:hypothetical protein
MDEDEDRLLFQIPVYRLSVDDWADDEEKRAEPYVTEMSKIRPVEQARSLAAHLINSQEWEYNEVLGWIEVIGFHDVIKVYLHFRKGERFHRHPTSHFERLYKMTEVWIEGMTNSKIARELRESIVEEWKTDPRLKRRELDMRAFDKISPYLDWRSMLGTRN